MPTERPAGVRERERRGREGRERGRMRGLEEEGFEGSTSPVPEERKCMAMHYLVRPVLVLFIKEHGWSNTRLFHEKRREVEELPKCHPYIISSSINILHVLCLILYIFIQNSVLVWKLLDLH